MKTWLDFLFQCLNTLNQYSPLTIALITLWNRVSEGRKAKRKSLIEEQNLSVATRIAAALEAIATRTSQSKESLTVVEKLPSINGTLLEPTMPKFLPPPALPKDCLPPPALPKGCLPPPALPSGFPLERCLLIPAI